MRNTVWYCVTSQLCDPVLLVAGFVEMFLNIHPPLHYIFIYSVIVVAISHILIAIYLNSNESSGGTSGCKGGIFLKIHNFQWSHTSIKDADMFAISK
jgi:hypothetical protein